MRKKELQKKYEEQVIAIESLKYEKTCLLKENESFEKQIDKLAEAINQKTEKCLVGVWCENCRHKRYVTKPTLTFTGCIGFPTWVDKDYKFYCGKFINTYCKHYEEKEE